MFSTVKSLSARPFLKCIVFHQSTANDYELKFTETKKMLLKFFLQLPRLSRNRNPYRVTGRGALSWDVGYECGMDNKIS